MVWIKRNISNIIAGLLSLVWLYPFYLMIVNSLKSRKELFNNTLGLPKEVVGTNYTEAFDRLDFVKSFFNTLTITFFSIILLVLCSSLAAYGLSRGKKKISDKVYFIITLTMLIPFQAIMIPLISVAGKANMLSKPGLIFMYLGLGSSMAIFLYYGALRGIPKALDEAATIDGANRWQVFIHVIFPMLKPTTMTVIVLNSLWFWNDYLLPSLVVNKEGSYTISLKMFYFFGEYSKQWNLALAGLIIAIIPIIILYIFAQKHIMKGISDGAIK